MSCLHPSVIIISLSYHVFLLTGKGCNDAATISVAKHVASGHNVAIRQIDLEKADIDYNTLQVSAELYQ